MKTYNKLVRDRIPDIIKADGVDCIFHVADNEEYVKKLYEKLDEEFTEFKENPTVEEFADMMEVLTSIALHHKINLETVKEVKRDKRNARGGFNDRVILDSTT